MRVSVFAFFFGQLFKHSSADYIFNPYQPGMVCVMGVIYQTLAKVLSQVAAIVICLDLALWVGCIKVNAIKVHVAIAYRFKICSIPATIPDAEVEIFVAVVSGMTFSCSMVILQSLSLISGIHSYSEKHLFIFIHGKHS